MTDRLRAPGRHTSEHGVSNMTKALNHGFDGNARRRYPPQVLYQRVMRKFEMMGLSPSPDDILAALAKAEQAHTVLEAKGLMTEEGRIRANQGVAQFLDFYLEKHE